MAMFDRFRRRPEQQENQMGGFPVAPKTPFGANVPEQGEMPIPGGGTIGGRPALPDMMQRGNMGGFPAAQQVPFGGQDSEPETGIIDRLQAQREDSVQEARENGMRMGAEQAMMDAGIEPLRIRKIQEDDRIMNRERLNKATATLMKYKEGKASVNRRVIEAQNWWKLNNWDEQRKERGTKGASEYKSSTGWLWNCIVGKHADAIDSYPEPVILPRALDDKEEAQKLSKIIPVVMEINGFENVYSEAAWQKMQEGTGVYGIFWDPEKLNGLGDISIKRINILNLYWEPGVQDIQDSRNVFYVHYEDTEDILQEHPELEGEINNGTRISIDKYQTDDHISLDGKSLVIDWYYHKKINGQKTLQYCQYVNESVLYSTEENNGVPLYEHGLYPFVLDPLFPVAGSPAGYGYIDIGKDTQMDIDVLRQAMVKNTEVASTPRYFIRKDGGINEQEFADTSKPFVHTNGMLGKDSIMPIECPQLPGAAMNMLQQLIDELKFITGNTDINNGGVPSGVTAASAIAALKEDSGRSSKDSTKAAYRSYRLIVNMVIELIRQFYNIPRQFRIIGQDGQDEFTQYDNQNIAAQPVPNGFGVEDGMRMPVFDIDVRAQRENAYTKMSQNELAIQFYQIGAMNPQNTDQALMLLDMMDFKGKEEIRQKIQQNGTMQDALGKISQIAMVMAQQYRPDLLPQIQQMIQGAGGGGPAGGGGAAQGVAAPSDNMSAADPNENGIVRKARERAANATRPS